MTRLILLRHGQSVWNHANRFTGWVNVPLSQLGIEQALTAGRTLATQPIDCVFTSILMRAEQTAMLAMSQHQSNRTPILMPLTEKMKEHATIHSQSARAETIPCYRDWRLNERFYGDLQGENKSETRAKYGDEQVHIWRRSYDISPPGGESLHATAERTIPCLIDRIEPELKRGHHCFVSAHGNSIRSLIMHMEHIPPEQIVNLEIPLGEPLIFEYDDNHYTRVEA